MRTFKPVAFGDLQFQGYSERVRCYRTQLFLEAEPLYWHSYQKVV